MLLSIDNIPLDTCTIEEAVRLLQKSSDIVKLRVKKNLSSLDEFEPSSNTVIYSVELNRKGGHLGITIAGNDDQVDPIIISQMAPGGIAEKYGGDKKFDILSFLLFHDTLLELARFILATEF